MRTRPERHEVGPTTSGAGRPARASEGIAGAGIDQLEKPVASPVAVVGSRSAEPFFDPFAFLAPFAGGGGGGGDVGLVGRVAVEVRVGVLPVRGHPVQHHADDVGIELA